MPDQTGTEDPQLVLGRIRGLLQAPVKGRPEEHDMLNALHTVLTSIEMLDLDLPDELREVFARLQEGADKLDREMQIYLRSQASLKSQIRKELTVFRAP